MSQWPRGLKNIGHWDQTKNKMWWLVLGMPGGRETLFSLSVLVCVGMGLIKRAGQLKTALPSANRVQLKLKNILPIWLIFLVTEDEAESSVCQVMLSYYLSEQEIILLFYSITLLFCNSRCNRIIQIHAGYCLFDALVRVRVRAKTNCDKIEGYESLVGNITFWSRPHNNWTSCYVVAKMWTFLWIS